MAKDVTGKSATELLGVMEMSKVGRDRLIVSAVDLCYRNGFNAVGLDQIITHAGVTKTTFYKHFESKDDLLIAAIQARDSWESEAWERAVQMYGGADPVQQLLAMYDILHVWFNDPIYGGCMFINAASEFPNPNDPIHQAAANHKQKFWGWVRSLGEQAGIKDTQSFADNYVILFEGTLIMRQVYGRNDAAQAAKAQVEQLLATHLPEGA